MPHHTIPHQLIAVAKLLDSEISDDPKRTAALEPIITDLVTARTVTPALMMPPPTPLEESYATLLAQAPTLLTPLTYEEYLKMRKDFMDKKRALYYRNLTFDDILKAIRTQRISMNKLQRSRVRTAKRIATDVRRLLRTYRPPRS